jgi:hypothetical protein
MPSFKENAARIANSMRAHGGGFYAAGLIEAFAEEH